MSWVYSLNDLAAAIGAEWRGASLQFSGVSTDTRTIEPGQVFFALTGERFNGADFVPTAFEKGAAAAVSTQPSAAGPTLVTSNTLEALQRFAALHRRRRPIPIIAITGSCGKTTVKEMTAAILQTRYNVVKTRGNLNNEIGLPLSLLTIDGNAQLAVLEMGANHTGEITRLCELAAPNESMITMIAPAHLEGFGTIENVARAKAEIVEALPQHGIFYVNADDERCRRIAESFTGEKVTFGRGGEVRLETCAPEGDNEMRLRIAPLGELRLPLACPAHAINVTAAVAVGLRHGVTEFETPLRRVCETPTRFTIIRIGPLQILDDSYNANPASMAAALDSLAQRPAPGARMAALGDMLELGPAAPEYHRKLGAYAAKQGVNRLYARGDFAPDIVAGARQAGLHAAEAMAEHADIARAIHAVARPGDTLLVKGSRGMRMERVIEALRGLYG